MPFQCHWSVAWAAGTLTAQGLDANGNVVCSDQKVTAGAPDHIALVVDTPIVKPNGEVFTITANATDAALILAKVVDANGNWCPTDSSLVTFAVSGPGNYRGGSDQFVTANKPLGYHSPLDPEVTTAEPMMKIVQRPFLRSTCSCACSACARRWASNAFGEARELDQLRILANLLPVARVDVDDDVVAVEDALFHLGDDLGQGERAVIELVLLDEPALVLLGQTHGIRDMKDLPMLSRAEGAFGCTAAGCTPPAMLARTAPSASSSSLGLEKRVSDSGAMPRATTASTAGGTAEFT